MRWFSHARSKNLTLTAVFQNLTPAWVSWAFGASRILAQILALRLVRGIPGFREMREFARAGWQNLALTAVGCIIPGQIPVCIVRPVLPELRFQVGALARFVGNLGVLRGR